MEVELEDVVEDMCETVVGEIVGIEMCCLDELPTSRGGVPIFGVGSDAVLPELRGREVAGDGGQGGGVCVEVDGCGGEIIEPQPSGMVLYPDCLCKPAI